MVSRPVALAGTDVILSKSALYTTILESVVVPFGTRIVVCMRVMVGEQEQHSTDRPYPSRRAQQQDRSVNGQQYNDRNGAASLVCVCRLEAAEIRP
jgi:hypothetical protein